MRSTVSGDVATYQTSSLCAGCLSSARSSPAQQTITSARARQVPTSCTFIARSRRRSVLAQLLAHAPGHQHAEVLCDLRVGGELGQFLLVDLVHFVDRCVGLACDRFLAVLMVPGIRKAACC